MINYEINYANAVAIIAATGGIVFYFIYKYSNKSVNAKRHIENIMEEYDLTFEEAKEKLITEKLGSLFEIDSKTLEIDNLKIEQGNRIAFTSDEFGYISGDFIGAKKSKAEGYTWHFVVKKTDNKIISAPIETILTDTLMVYER